MAAAQAQGAAQEAQAAAEAARADAAALARRLAAAEELLGEVRGLRNTLCTSGSCTSAVMAFVSPGGSYVRRTQPCCTPKILQTKCAPAHSLQREEEVAELAADLNDVKLAYREQVEFLVSRLEAARAQGDSATAGAVAGGASVQ